MIAPLPKLTVRVRFPSPALREKVKVALCAGRRSLEADAAWAGRVVLGVYAAGSGRVLQQLPLESSCARALWVARLIVSQATRAKLSSKHNLDAEDVLDAIVCVAGLSCRWDDDPELVEAHIRGATVIVMLYPVADPS